jgi:hypothetical protein
MAIAAMATRIDSADISPNLENAISSLGSK